MACKLYEPHYKKEKPMKTKKFRLNKLVRDKVKDIFEKDNCTVYVKELSDDEYIQALHDKLYEEVEELCDVESKEELIEEMADIFQVLETICTMADVSVESIIKTQEEKLEKKGGFQDGLFIDYIEHAEDHPYTEYYAKQPDKYPEIK